jgi:hypothetical protein
VSSSPRMELCGSATAGAGREPRLRQQCRERAMCGTPDACSAARRGSSSGICEAYSTRRSKPVVSPVEIASVGRGDGQVFDTGEP